MAEENIPTELDFRWSLRGGRTWRLHMTDNDGEYFLTMIYRPKDVGEVISCRAIRHAMNGTESEHMWKDFSEAIASMIMEAATKNKKLYPNG